MKRLQISTWITFVASYLNRMRNLKLYQRTSLYERQSKLLGMYLALRNCLNVILTLPLIINHKYSSKLLFQFALSKIKTKSWYWLYSVLQFLSKLNVLWEFLIIRCTTRAECRSPKVPWWSEEWVVV